ncbi:MAG TPA: DNA-3-methyladenine glycosylase [Bacillota bacterium]|nr:DNA-3-methyladenine glycosylase [Bacillota bacterium]
MEKLHFQRGDAILQTLSASDPILGGLIEKIGDYQLNLRSDCFPALVRSIIGQQLSVKAAGTIWLRTQDLCVSKGDGSEFCPETILSLSEEALRGAGLSRTKVVYIKDLAQRVSAGELDFQTLRLLPNLEIINRLTAVKGIGTWTAEMFLIFSLGRLDVLSLKDLGLRRAIQWLYGLKQSPVERTMLKYGKKWAPYQTVASLYLWEVINRGLIKEDPGNLRVK